MDNFQKPKRQASHVQLFISVISWYLHLSHSHGLQMQAKALTDDLASRTLRISKLVKRKIARGMN